MKQYVDTLVSLTAAEMLACALHATGAMAEGFAYYGEEGPDHRGGGTE